MEQDDFQLDPQRWAALRRLLDEALQREPAQRAAWLDTLGGPLEEFKPRLRALLEHAQGPANGLLDTLPKVETADFAPPPHEAMPERIGPYRLLRELGSGGMASVWLAERTDMLQGRQVALKLPHGDWGAYGARGAGRRAGLAERMAREREILATLNHPNIASLYDAGVADDGQPYLALEYVEGERIDVHCASHGLDLRARLRLFLQAARAVAHAHAHLVVHRDLKPSNILVNAVGSVRLLDFGIAKLLDQGLAAETELTQQAGRALTPDYASPEQIRGEPIGTASDVYTLGVVLYELLAGARPYRLERASRAVLEDAILKAEPKRLSDSTGDARLRRQLRGDLDTIVAKALKKSVTERYATVDALADDIERHLDQRPVLARPDTVGYRLRKTVARHRVATLAAGAVLVAVLLGASAAVWQARVAIAQQQRAEEVKEFVATIFKDADPFGAKTSKPTVAQLLQQARARLDGRFSGQPELRVELLSLVGESLLSIGEIDAADAALAQAIQEGTAALGTRHLLVLRARINMAEVHHWNARIPQMQAVLEGLLPDLRQAAGVKPADLVAANESSAGLAWEQGRYADALADAEEADAIARRHLDARNPRAVSASIAVAQASSYGTDHERSLRASQHALQRARDVYGSDRPHARVLNARGLYARALGDVGRYREAVDEATQVVRESEQLLGSDAAFIAFVTHDLARFQIEVGDLRGSLASSERTMRYVARLAPSNSAMVANAAYQLGRAQLAARQAAPALATLRSARDTMRRARGAGDPVTLDIGIHVALALALGGELDAAQSEIEPLIAPQQSASAARKFRALHHAGVIARLRHDAAAATAHQLAALQAVGSQTMHALRRRMAHTELALIAIDRGDAAQALTWLQSEPAADGAPTMPSQADFHLVLGRVQLAQGRAAQAERALETADAFWREFDPSSRWAGEAAYWLGRCHAAQGRHAAAQQALARAARILAMSPFADDRTLLARSTRE